MDVEFIKQQGRTGCSARTHGAKSFAQLAFNGLTVARACDQLANLIPRQRFIAECEPEVRLEMRFGTNLSLARPHLVV